MIRRGIVAALCLGAGIGCASSQKAGESRIPIATRGEGPDLKCEVEISNTAGQSVLLVRGTKAQRTTIGELSSGGTAIFSFPCSNRHIRVYGVAFDKVDGPPIAHGGARLSPGEVMRVNLVPFRLR